MSDCTPTHNFFTTARTFGVTLAAFGFVAGATMAQSPSPSDFENLVDDEFMEADEPGFGSEGIDGDTSGVNVSSFLTVEIHVQDTDLADVLQMLSIQSRKNIIVSRNVAATVTADLYDVTFYEALDAILNANGYGYREDGSFIYIYTLDELRAIEDAERVMEHMTFNLSYLNAQDAAVFVTPLLSDDGSIAINGEVSAGIDPSVDDVGGASWSNSATLVVHDFQENLKSIGDLIGELDTRPQQVLVEATVLQTKLNEANALGIDYSIIADVDFSNFTNPLSGVNDLLNGDAGDGFTPPDNQAFVGQSQMGSVSGPATLKIGVISEDISVFMRVLDEVSETTVLSRPKVLALNRQRGEILIGAQIGYLSTTATETSTTQTVEFLDTGTKLLFRPFIAKDGHIRMELAPSVSEGLIREVTSASGDSVTIPDRITQELTTNVVVRDGHTIVLGGLFREQTDVSRRQIPVLGDIPLVGNAFKGRDDATERQEIIFLITPTIMKDEYLSAMGEEGVNAVRRAQIGARKGVLVWSNDRMTAQHAMRAEELYRAGNTEEALWEVERSLSLRSNQPQVMALRERITGEQDTAFQRALISPLVDSAVTEHMAMQAQRHIQDATTITEAAPQGESDDQSLATLRTISDTEIDTAEIDETQSDIEDIETAGIDSMELEPIEFETTQVDTTDIDGEFDTLVNTETDGDIVETIEDGAATDIVEEFEAGTQESTDSIEHEGQIAFIEPLETEETVEAPIIGDMTEADETDAASTVLTESEWSAEDWLAMDPEFAEDFASTLETSNETSQIEQDGAKDFEEVPNRLALSGQVPGDSDQPFTITLVWNRIQSMLYLDMDLGDEPQFAEVDTEFDEDIK